MLFITILVSVQIFLLQAIEYPKNDNIYYLDNSNFQQFFQSQKFQIIVVKYFKLGCSNCRKFHPAYKEIAKDFLQNGQKGIAFAEIDIMDPENKKLKKYLFTDTKTAIIFPAIKIYFGGLENGIIYNEKVKNKEQILEWIQQQINQQQTPKQEL